MSNFIANCRRQSCFLLLVLLVPAALAGTDPWADRVTGYDPGTTPVPGYTDPDTALGAPERFTGEGSFPSVVSVFNPPFGNDELVSVGEGGFLTLAFDEPIVDAANHRFGVDFIVFGNGGFVDVDFPNGRVGSPPLTFGFDRMDISVSADGSQFVALPGPFTEGLFPTQGFLDAGPYDGVPGSVPTDFLRPVDPSLALEAFAGASLADVLALYDGSGGGTPIDISASGLGSVSYVRIEVPDDGNPNTALSVHVDALATVPEPSTFSVIGVVVLCGAVGKKRRNRSPRFPDGPRPSGKRRADSGRDSAPHVGRLTQPVS